MERDTDDEKSADEIRERLRIAGLLLHVTDRSAPGKPGAKILPFKRIQKPTTIRRKGNIAAKRRIAGAIYLLLLAAITFVSLR